MATTLKKETNEAPKIIPATPTMCWIYGTFYKNKEGDDFFMITVNFKEDNFYYALKSTITQEEAKNILLKIEETIDNYVVKNPPTVDNIKAYFKNILNDTKFGEVEEKGFFKIDVPKTNNFIYLVKAIPYLKIEKVNKVE